MRVSASLAVLISSSFALLLLQLHSLEATAVGVAPQWIGRLELQQLQISNSKTSRFEVSRIADGAVLFGSNNIMQASAVACNFSIDSGFIDPSPCPDGWTWPDAEVTDVSPAHANPAAAVVEVSVCSSAECISILLVINETSNISFSMQVSTQGQEQRVRRVSVGAQLLDSKDIVFAGGEQFSLMNMVHTRLHMISSEKGVGRGMQPLTDIMNSQTPGKGGKWWTTYTHFPALLQRNGWAVVAAAGDYTVFDFTKPHHVSIEIQASDFSLQVLLGNNLMEAVARMSSMTAFMQPLPSWVHSGAIVGLEGGQSNVNRGLDSVQAAVKSYNLSVAGVWIQDWSGMRVFPDRVGLWWNWQLDSDHYPDFPAICTRARELGARLLTYFNPQLINISAYDDAPKHAANVFKAAHELGFLVTNNDGSLWTGYNGAAMLALHKPEVAAWTAALIAAQVRNFAYRWLVLLIYSMIFGCIWILTQQAVAVGRLAGARIYG
jgi:alpha-glucosidase (family GH31 glycosyl hydrolase)